VRKTRILLIDDEPSFTRLLRLNLEETGRYEVKEENKPLRAVATVEWFNPDLILLDIVMPEMDGADLAADLLKRPMLKNIPIVFLTAVVTKQETNQGDGFIGGNFFIAKPVTVREVTDCIEKLLRHRPVVAAEAEAVPGAVEYGMWPGR